MTRTQCRSASVSRARRTWDNPGRSCPLRYVAPGPDPAGRQHRPAVRTDEPGSTPTHIPGAGFGVRDRGALKSTLSEAQATYVIYALTSPELRRILRDERAWTAEQYETWLADTLCVDPS